MDSVGQSARPFSFYGACMAQWLPRDSDEVFSDSAAQSARPFSFYGARMAQWRPHDSEGGSLDSAGLEGSAVFSLRRVDGDDDLHRAGLFFDAAVGLHADPVQLANRVEHGVDEDPVVAQDVADVRLGRLGRE